MTKNLTLVIMAGGLGSRFGGLKQVEPIDKNGNFIIDYSIFDAIKAGFNKVVFIINKKHHELFKKSIGERISKHIDVEYAFQSTSDFLPQEMLKNLIRTKPWGTGQAVLCAKKFVEGDFVVINADDFYGRDGFLVTSRFFEENKGEKVYGLVGYFAGNTLTENGIVKRGVMKSSKGLLESVDESFVERVDGQIYATSLATNKKIKIADTKLVSVNLLCFKHSYFDVLELCFNKFLNDKNTNLEKDEFFVLSPAEYATKHWGATMKVLSTTSVWQGVTYKEDKEKVVSYISKLIEEGVYPKNLWGTK